MGNCRFSLIGKEKISIAYICSKYCQYTLPKCSVQVKCDLLSRPFYCAPLYIEHVKEIVFLTEAFAPKLPKTNVFFFHNKTKFLFVKFLQTFLLISYKI